MITFAVLDLRWEHDLISACGAAGAALDLMGSTIRNALVLQFISSAVGLAFCALAVTLVEHTFWLFCLLFGVGLMGLFVATAPLCEPLFPLSSTPQHAHSADLC